LTPTPDPDPDPNQVHNLLSPLKSSTVLHVRRRLLRHAALAPARGAARRRHRPRRLCTRVGTRAHTSRLTHNSCAAASGRPPQAALALPAASPVTKRRPHPRPKPPQTCARSPPARAAPPSPHARLRRPRGSFRSRRPHRAHLLPRERELPPTLRADVP